MRLMVSTLALLMLAGCAGFRRDANVANADRRHGPACEQIGYAPATDAWIDCTTRLERARRAKVSPVEMTASDGRKVSCKFGPTACE